MTNILIDEFPTSISVNGVAYPIYTDYRFALRIMLSFEDPLLTMQERQMIILKNIYKEIPLDIEQAIIQSISYLNLGNTDSEESPYRLFSYSKDANYIFAAFKQTHGIDLDQVELHWFKFMALFMDLGQDTAFCSLTALRKRIKSGKATKDEKILARELGPVFDVPDLDLRSLEQREKEVGFMEIFYAGKKSKHEETSRDV